MFHNCNATEFCVVKPKKRNSDVLKAYHDEKCARQFMYILLFTLHYNHSESESHIVVSDSLRPHGLYSPWNSPGQNAGVGRLSILQGISQTQGSNSGSNIVGGFFTSWATREAQEYGNGSPIPSPADLPDPGIKPESPALQTILYQLSSHNFMSNLYLMSSNFCNLTQSIKWQTQNLSPKLTDSRK